MNLHSTAKTAYSGLRAKKSRSILTILGIVIGVTAIILIMSLGQGAQDLILGQFEGIGSKIVAVVPGRQPKGPTDVFSTFTDSLKQKDLAALENKNNVPNLAKIMPIVFGSESLAYQNDTYRATIFGVSEAAADIYDLHPETGRFFEKEEIRAYADVLVIGPKVKKELFGESEAIGAKIKIKGKNFRIIGILPQKGQVSFLNFDEAAIIPYSTAQQYIFGIKYFNRIAIEADEEKNISRLVNDIKTTLRTSHRIDDPEKDDFFVETSTEAIAAISTVTDIFTLFLAAIAAISLVVGGIGIMNIMLVSVTERTREIGLRKALGATNRDILTQFILEAIFLTVAGGIIGVILGASFSFLASLILSQTLNLDWTFTFPIQGAILGIVVSSVIGLVFGLYPAIQAARKNPIEALRYE